MMREREQPQAPRASPTGPPSMRTRYGRFPLVALLIGLLVSLLFHVEAPEAVQLIAKLTMLWSGGANIDNRDPKLGKPEALEFTILEVPEEPEDVEEPIAPPTPESRPEPEREREPERRRRVQRPPPQPQVTEQELRQQLAEQQRPPPPERELQSVEQPAQTPDQPPPEDVRFLAEHNNRTDEETTARLRNDVRDDAEPSVAEARVPGLEEEGNDTTTEVAHRRTMEGSDVREPTPTEAQENRPEQASTEPPPMLEESRGNTSTEGESGRTLDGADRARDPGQEGGGETEPTDVEINDGFGTIVVRQREARPRGTGEGDQGREQRSGPDERELLRRGQAGEGRGIMDVGPNARPAWSELSRLLDEDQLQRERETFIAERQSTSRGSHHRESWREFRAALENFTPTVRPGNQTALNTAASPFASYLAQVHRRIHRQFADRFLRGLPSWSTSEYADRSLRTQLEIVFNQDGTVHRVGVVHTSGYLPFDFGAFNAVMRGQPFPEPPPSILSGDGRVYVHWGFYRNERQCGTFNAAPYILPNPPGTPQEPSGLRDSLQLGGVVPADAQPTYGLPGQPGGPATEVPEESEPEE